MVKNFSNLWLANRGFWEGCPLGVEKQKRVSMFILEGNTGVGKSTFLKLLQEHAPEISVIQESVDSWAFQMHGQSLLGNFYENPKRWAYTMETMTMMTRVREHTYHQVHAQPASLMERSVYSGHYCFAKNGHVEGFFTGLEWEVYLKWMEFMVLDTCKPPRGFIYLQASPESCFARLRERARVGEEAVTLEYMEQLHDWHEKFMITREGIDPRVAQVPVLVLDATVDLRRNTAVAASYVAQVKAFMQDRIGSEQVVPARVASGEFTENFG